MGPPGCFFPPPPLAGPELILPLVLGVGPELNTTFAPKGWVRVDIPLFPRVGTFFFVIIIIALCSQGWARVDATSGPRGWARIDYHTFVSKGWDRVDIPLLPRVGADTFLCSQGLGQS